MTQRLSTPWFWIKESVSPLPRFHLLILLIIVLVGFLRGLFWVATTEVWHPIDEAQHYAYVQSLASGDGIPVVGVDHVSAEVLSVAKISPTLGFRNHPLQVSTEDRSWGIFREQYEGGGVQGPLYYGLMVVPYWLSHPFGVLPSIYALRIASVLVSLLAVPLAWLLARELFPRQPVIWLAAPALLVIVQGFNANLASVNNDALMVPLAVAALIPIARAWRGLTFMQAAAGGALFGAAVLTKSTNITLAPVIGVVLVALVLLRREPIRKVVRWSLLSAGVAFMVLLPYLAWNLAIYGAFSASKEVNAITGPALPNVPFSLDGLHDHWRNARTGLWEFQAYSPGPGIAYISILEWTTAIAFLMGGAAALARRSYHRAASLAWLAAAFPVAFLTIVALTYAVFDSGSPVGRHLYIALVPLCILIVAGLITALGARWGVIALLLVVTLALGAEQGIIRRYADGVYASGVIGASLASRVDQSWNDGYVSARAVQVRPLCPVEVIGLGVSADSGPPAVAIAQGSAERPAQLIGVDRNVALYTLEGPISTDFTINLPQGSLVGSSRLEREPSVAFADSRADPMVRLYCQTDDAKAVRFAQLYGPQHPSGVTYDRVQLWAEAWPWIARIALGVALATAIVSEVARLRRRQHASRAARAGEL